MFRAEHFGTTGHEWARHFWSHLPEKWRTGVCGGKRLSQVNDLANLDSRNELHQDLRMTEEGSKASFLGRGTLLCCRAARRRPQLLEQYIVHGIEAP